MSTFYPQNDYRGYLSHHGVKGQKWGVRHGPPYPIKSGIMPKGTVRSTTTASPMYSGLRAKKMYTYDPDNEHDKKVYTGPFAKYAMSRLTNKFGFTPQLYDAKFKTTKDLRIAGKEDQIDDAFKLAKENKEAIKDLKFIKDYIEGEYNKGEKLTERNNRIATAKVDFNNLTEKDKEFVFDTLNAMMESADNFSMSRQFTEIMNTKFDGIVDFNNQGVYNDAQDPVLIFNPRDNMTVIDIKEIPMSMINENHNAISDYMRKTGRNAAL